MKRKKNEFLKITYFKKFYLFTTQDNFVRVLQYNAAQHYRSYNAKILSKTFFYFLHKFDLFPMRLSFDTKCFMEFQVENKKDTFLFLRRK